MFNIRTKNCLSRKSHGPNAGASLWSQDPTRLLTKTIGLASSDKSSFGTPTSEWTLIVPRARQETKSKSKGLLSFGPLCSFPRTTVIHCYEIGCLHHPSFILQQFGTLKLRCQQAAFPLKAQWDIVSLALWASSDSKCSLACGYTVPVSPWSPCLSSPLCVSLCQLLYCNVIGFRACLALSQLSTFNTITLTKTLFFSPKEVSNHRFQVLEHLLLGNNSTLCIPCLTSHL